MGPITVFGGTGFLGRRVVRHLAERNVIVRVTARHPNRVNDNQFHQNAHAVEADVRDPESVENAVAGATAVVNCVGLYREHHGETFQAVHVEGAECVADAARRSGSERLVHISGIGVDRIKNSAFVEHRALAEARIEDVFPKPTIMRPSVMFADADSFIQKIEGLLRTMPILPIFGRGETRLQPIHADDVAKAICTALERPRTKGKTYELGGPEILTYRQIAQDVREAIGSRTPLLPVPFAVWNVTAWLLSVLPDPPVTKSQVELMQYDNVVHPERAGVDALDMAPRPVKSVLKSAACVGDKK